MNAKDLRDFLKDVPDDAIIEVEEDDWSELHPWQFRVVLRTEKVFNFDKYPSSKKLIADM